MDCAPSTTNPAPTDSDKHDQGARQLRQAALFARAPAWGWGHGLAAGACLVRQTV